MTDLAGLTLTELVARRPQAARRLDALGVDNCCTATASSPARTKPPAPRRPTSSRTTSRETHHRYLHAEPPSIDALAE